MKKQLFYKVYSAAFIAVCMTPAVFTPIIKQDQSAEKRILSDFPSFRSADGGLNTDFFEQFDTWFSEHFAFRQQLVTADNKLKTTVLHTSDDTDVICGSDGWLYYGQTLDDYLNTNQMTEREINNIAHDLKLIDSYCKENGIKFIFTCVPDKNSVYPEHMPYNYVPVNNSDNYSILSDALKDTDFYCDMKESLLSARSNTPLYHKTDTHWNNLGAYAGYCGLMTAAGKEPLPIGYDWFSAYDHRGDLAAMIYPSDQPEDRQIYTAYQFTYEYSSPFHALDDIIIDTVADGRDGSLLMFRDSFGEAILKYMAESYGTAEFSRAVPYKINSKAENAPDTIIVEIVERNLQNLIKKSPVMEAPFAEKTSGFADTMLSGTLTHFTEHIGGLTHIYGVVPDEFFSGTHSRILVSTGSNCYEAFNACETDLMELSESTPYGFSLYVPDTEQTNNIIITAVNNDGSSFSSLSAER